MCVHSRCLQVSSPFVVSLVAAPVLPPSLQINYFAKKPNNRLLNKKLKLDIDLLCQMIEFQFNIDNSQHYTDPDVIMMTPY